MRTRLVPVEGLIGSGRTTLTTTLAGSLTDAGAQVRCVTEGDPEHPADFEQVALLADEDLVALAAEHPDALPAVLAASTRDPEGTLVPYGVLAREADRRLRDAVVSRLARHDVYELPLDQHVRLRRRLWSRFVGDVVAGETVWVLDCCLLQNPVTVSALRDDAPEPVVRALVDALAADAGRAGAVVVHLHRADAGEAFRAVAAERPGWWLEHVVAYYTGRGLGCRLGASGVDGVVDVLREREALELRILAGLRLPVLRADVTQPGAAEALVADVGARVVGVPGTGSGPDRARRPASLPHGDRPPSGWSRG